jgi:type IV/VI secretion system ImpK/VasF family protein
MNVNANANGRRLWFEIARVIADIQKLCADARAVELREEAHRERSPLAADRPELDPAYGEDPVVVIDDEDTAPAREVPLGRELLLPNDPGTRPALAVDIVALRSEIRSRLTLLKSRLGEVLTEREVYYTVFPIVVYVDELVQIATAGRASDWPPLQRELYDVDNGGELFYTIIETLLKREETSPLIFETFYFCLNAGFLGQHQSEPTKIDEYKARLAFRIPIQRPPVEAGSGEAAPVELVPFPTWYYAAAAGAVVGLFLILHLFGFLETAPLS